MLSKADRLYTKNVKHLLEYLGQQGVEDINGIICECCEKIWNAGVDKGFEVCEEFKNSEILSKLYLDRSE